MDPVWTTVIIVLIVIFGIVITAWRSKRFRLYFTEMRILGIFSLKSFGMGKNETDPSIKKTTDGKLIEHNDATLSPTTQSIFDSLRDIDREFTLVISGFPDLKGDELGIVLVRRVLVHAQNLFSRVVWQCNDSKIVTSLKILDPKSDSRLLCYYPDGVELPLRQGLTEVESAGTFAGDVFEKKKPRFVADAIKICRSETRDNLSLINKYGIESLAVWPITVRNNEQDEVVACLKVDCSKKSVICENPLSKIVFEALATKFSSVMQLVHSGSWNPVFTED
jgi:hypothetical protein